MKLINAANPDCLRLCFLTDDHDDEGDKSKARCVPITTKAAQKRKWELAPYLFNALPAPHPRLSRVFQLFLIFLSAMVAAAAAAAHMAEMIS